MKALCRICKNEFDVTIIAFAWKMIRALLSADGRRAIHSIGMGGAEALDERNLEKIAYVCPKCRKASPK